LWKKSVDKGPAIVEIEFGNVGQLDTHGTGWFIGFSDWVKSRDDQIPSLRYMPKDHLAHTLHAKWMSHPVHDDRGTHKPPSEGRTISLLVSNEGLFRLQFAPNDVFSESQTVEYRLNNHGDFVIWGEHIHHRWFVDQACTILTLRWIPLSSSSS
jgi:hypothetical protein